MKPREILEELDRRGATLYWSEAERMLRSNSALPEDLQHAIVLNEEELLKILAVDWEGHGTSARFPKEPE